MARHRTAVFAMLLVVSATVGATAQSGLILGTEELPELVDAGNDVSYDPVYPGAQDHHYLDVTAAWFQHDPHVGVVFLNLKVADATRLAADTTGWTIQCQFGSTMTTDGQNTGRLLYFWTKDSQSDALRSGVQWSEDGGGNVNVGDTTPAIKHTFAVTLEMPGYFVFGITQEQLVLLGDELGDLSATCYEVFDPSNEVGFLFNNGDAAESQGSYSVKELRQTKRHDGSLDPIEKLPTESAEPSASETKKGSTPGFTLVLAGVAIGSFALLRRRH